MKYTSPSPNSSQLDIPIYQTLNLLQLFPEVQPHVIVHRLQAVYRAIGIGMHVRRKLSENAQSVEKSMQTEVLEQRCVYFGEAQFLLPPSPSLTTTTWKTISTCIHLSLDTLTYSIHPSPVECHSVPFPASQQVPNISILSIHYPLPQHHTQRDQRHEESQTDAKRPARFQE